MFLQWASATIFIFNCLNFDLTSCSENGSNLPVCRVCEQKNFTYVWEVQNVVKGSQVAIQLGGTTLLRFNFGTPTYNDMTDHIEPAGNGNYTFGFTIVNVSLSDGGIYQCVYNKKSQKIVLFVWGKPEKAQVIPKNNEVICYVNSTSQPTEQRPRMEYKWYRNETILLTATLRHVLTQQDEGYWLSCSGREINSTCRHLWSDRSDYYQPNFELFTRSPGAQGSTSRPSNTTDNKQSGDNTNDKLDTDSKEFLVIIILVSFSSLLLIAVVIALVFLCARKNATTGKEQCANNHQRGGELGEQDSSEEDTTEFVENQEYSDTYFESDSALGEYSDIREIDRLRTKDKEEDKHAELITDVYAVPMKKSGN